MADEFAKGLGILMAAGLGWMTLAGWYRTPSFEGKQLNAAVEISDPSIYQQLGLFLMEALFWFAVLGALTFWVVIPVFEEVRDVLAERREN
jgi:hypothetical protein